MSLLGRILRGARRARVLRRRRAGARRALAEVFSCPDRLEGTSLRPEHRSRAVLLDFASEGDRVAALTFGIVRHPRPHPFSRQFHEVLEVYRVGVAAGTPPTRLSGTNLSRARGGDGEPARGGPGI